MLHLLVDCGLQEAGQAKREAVKYCAWVGPAASFFRCFSTQVCLGSTLKQRNKSGTPRQDYEAPCGPRTCAMLLARDAVRSLRLLPATGSPSCRGRLRQPELLLPAATALGAEGPLTPCWRSPSQDGAAGHGSARPRGPSALLGDRLPP